jgi:ribokinase
MTRVLVVGDANLDLILRGDVAPRFGQAEQLLDAADLVLGSSAGICASGLARLGVATELCARVGDDLFGAETRRRLDALGVGVSEVGTVPGAATGLSVVLSQPADRGILTLLGAMSAVSADDVLAAVERTDAAHVHVASFFLLPGLAAGVPALFAALRARGVTTSLDTNWDPAGTWDGVADCLAVTDVLLPNAAEALALAAACGAASADPVDAALALSSRGSVVVVKDGAAGGFAAADGRIVRASGLALDVIDTTGAGDSFDAGFLAAWTEGRDLTEAVRWGAIAGSLSTRAAGGTAAQATRAELLGELP